jgi:hypothetical protein
MVKAVVASLVVTSLLVMFFFTQSQQNSAEKRRSDLRAITLSKLPDVIQNVFIIEDKIQDALEKEEDVSEHLKQLQNLTRSQLINWTYSGDPSKDEPVRLVIILAQRLRDLIEIPSHREDLQTDIATLKKQILEIYDATPEEEEKKL